MLLKNALSKFSGTIAILKVLCTAKQGLLSLTAHPQIKILSVMALYDERVMSSQKNWISVASENGILFVQ